ncbi:RluC: predicted ribosomal large subunit pseudouridine synthase C (rRNA pseudouridylate synthase C) [Desulfosarcina variabilis str. Montpellier]
MIIGSGPLKMTLLACGPTWWVVDKPCGVSIHNDPGNDVCAVVLAALEAGKLPAIRTDVTAVHAVHRLDRDTSGIVLLAGDSPTRAFFSKQFSERAVRKDYLAIVHGQLIGDPDASDRGQWDWPLTAGAAGRKHPMGKGKRVPCTTRWQLLAHSRHYSLVQCMPLTGRKHQIRRHAKLTGHPVVGDRRYGSMRALTYLTTHCQFDRLALHAHRLQIRLSRDEAPTIFVSDGLPDAMQRLLENDQDIVKDR